MALSTISGTTGITDATITSAKLADFTAAVDLNGVELILDADQDTTITADTDDRIDFKIAGVEHFSFSNSSGDSIIKPMVDTKDIIFQQYDGNKIFEINDGNYVGVGGNATAAGAIRIYEDTDNGSHYSGFTVGNLTASVTYALPNADGSSGQVLSTDGSGVLSWATASANTPTSADGQALGSASLEWSDLFLADASTIQFGNDQDVVLTHVADTGLLLSGTNVIQFNDASQNIGAPSNAILDINATDEIELNATLVDVNANLDVSGTYTGAGLMTTGGNIVIPDSGNIGSASDTDAIAIASNGQVTLTQTLIGTALDISGDIDIDGTTNLDVVDIDGAVDMASTLGVTGVVTANAGVVIDNITIDGTEIDLSSGDLTVDVAGDIILDAAGNDLSFAAGGTTVLTITNSSSDVVVKPIVDTKDLIFQQRDGTEVFRVEDGAYMSLAAMAVNPEATLTDASTISWNSLTSPVAKVTLGANRTIGAATGAVAGTFASLLVIQDGTGSRTLTWNAAYEFAEDTAPTLTTTANLGDLFVFRYNGAKWLEVGRNLALTLS